MIPQVVNTDLLPCASSSAADNEAVIVKSAPTNEALSLLPRVNDHVRFADEEDEFVVLSRNRKGVQGSKSWFNVKNVQNKIKKCVDFSSVKWTKVGNEVLYNNHDPPDVIKAKDQELERWKQYDVFEEVEDVGQEAITTRWIMTVKTNSGENLTKARLVARGFEEDTSSIRTDSPTISKECLRLVSAVAVSHQWTIHSLDVTAAFLQGFAMDRKVFLVPPAEAKTDNTLWRLKKPVYGLSDASRAWYLKASEEIKNQGATNSSLDSALFYLRKDSDLLGLIGSHVDDFFFNGSQLFHTQVVEHLRTEFSLSQELFDQMSFIGIEISQNSEGITMHQKAYIEEL